MHNPDYEPRYDANGQRIKPHRLDERVIRRDTKSPRGARFLVSGKFAQRTYSEGFEDLLGLGVNPQQTKNNSRKAKKS